MDAPVAREVNIPALFKGQQVGHHAKLEDPVEPGIPNGDIPTCGASLVCRPRKPQMERAQLHRGTI